MSGGGSRRASWRPISARRGVRRSEMTRRPQQLSERRRICVTGGLARLLWPCEAEALGEAMARLRGVSELDADDGTSDEAKSLINGASVMPMQSIESPVCV